MTTLQYADTIDPNVKFVKKNSRLQWTIGITAAMLIAAYGNHPTCTLHTSFP